MLAKALTATGKLFTLLALACCVLGVLSSEVRADPHNNLDSDTACNCGTPPTSPGPEWDAFLACYNSPNCSSARQTCGDAIAPGQPGHQAWADCYNSTLSIASCAYPRCADGCFLVEGGGTGGACTSQGVNTCPTYCICKKWLTIAICK